MQFNKETQCSFSVPVGAKFAIPDSETLTYIHTHTASTHACTHTYVHKPTPAAAASFVNVEYREVIFAYIAVTQGLFARYYVRLFAAAAAAAVAHCAVCVKCMFCVCVVFFLSF